MRQFVTICYAHRALQSAILSIPLTSTLAVRKSGLASGTACASGASRASWQLSLSALRLKMAAFEQIRPGEVAPAMGPVAKVDEVCSDRRERSGNDEGETEN